MRMFSLQELCAFGKFRELDDKIDELMDCSSVSQLFQSFVRRLEKDYVTEAALQTGRNIVEQVRHLPGGRHGDQDEVSHCLVVAARRLAIPPPP